MSLNRPDWGLRDRPVSSDPLEYERETGFYPDDPDGPETFEEAVDALVASVRDLWEITGLPVAQAAADKLQAGVDTWRDWWKPMDLSGHWTKGWTPEPTVFAEICRRIWETIKEGFMGKGPSPELRGIRGMTPDLFIRDEVQAFPGDRVDAFRYSIASFAKRDRAEDLETPFSIGYRAAMGYAGSLGLQRDLVAQAAAIEVIKVKAERVGLDWDDIVRRAREDPHAGKESEAIRRAFEAAMDEGIRDGTIAVHEPRGFLDLAVFDPADFIKVDPAVPPGVIATGLTPDQMARYREEIPFPQAETNRAFQDSRTGEWMTDEEDEDR